MHPILGPGLLLYLFIGGLYVYSFSRLHKIIKLERPEWLHYADKPSIFYRGMPRVADPNVNLRVTAIAFTRKVGDLTAPDAYRHAVLMRVLGPILLLLFAAFVVYSVTRAP